MKESLIHIHLKRREILNVTGRQYASDAHT